MSDNAVSRSAVGVRPRDARKILRLFIVTAVFWSLLVFYVFSSLMV